MAVAVAVAGTHVDDHVRDHPVTPELAFVEVRPGLHGVGDPVAIRLPVCRMQHRAPHAPTEQQPGRRRALVGAAAPRVRHGRRCAEDVRAHRGTGAPTLAEGTLVGCGCVLGSEPLLCAAAKRRDVIQG